MIRGCLCVFLTLSPVALAVQDAGQDRAFRDRVDRLRESLRERTQPLVRRDMQTHIRSLQAPLKLSDEQLRKLLEASDKAIGEMYDAVDKELADAKDAAAMSNILRTRLSELQREGPKKAKAWQDAIKKHLNKQQQADLAALQVRAQLEADRAELNARRAARAAPVAARGGFPANAARSIADAYARRLDTMEEQFRDGLEDELIRLEALCNLSDAQTSKLRTAIKGAALRTFKGPRAKIAEIIEKHADDENSDPRTIMIDLRDVTPATLSGSVAPPEVWTKAVEKTLTKEQRELMQRETEARTAFQRRVLVLELVNELDERALLTAAQREELEETLTQWKGALPPMTRRAGSTAAMLDLAADLRKQVLESLLTEQQMKRLTTRPRRQAVQFGGVGLRAAPVRPARQVRPARPADPGR